MVSSIEEKKNRLKTLLQERQRGEPDKHAIPKNSANETIPSYAQQRLWFLAELEGSNAAYNIPVAITLKGHLNQVALSASLNTIVQRHEVLRTRFIKVGGVPQLQLDAQIPLDLAVQGVEHQAACDRIYKEETQYLFDLEKDALFRVRLFQRAEDEHLLLVNMHHTVSDGWSVGVFLRELTALYCAHMIGAEPSIPALELQYADFAAWQREWLSGDLLQKQLSYWREKLKDVPVLLEMPTDRPRPPAQSHRGATLNFCFPESLLTRLEGLSQQHQVTLFMVVTAAFKMLLYRYSGQNDIAIGTGVANRRRPELESLIGFFVNTLVLRSQVSGELSFKELLAQIRETTLQAYAHQDIPFDLLVEGLKPERSMRYSPIIQVMLVLQNMPLEQKTELPGLSLTAEIPESGSAKFDLSISLQKSAAGLMGSIEYRTDIFVQSTIQRLLEHYRRVLEQIAESPGLKINQYTFLTPQETQQLLYDWNATHVDYPVHHCIHQLFEDWAHKTPDAVALAFDDSRFSYAELNARANQLAHFLLEQGVQANTFVGLSVRRSPDMIIAMLAILKAGAAYVPLDADYPVARLEYMLKDTGIRFLISEIAVQTRLPQVGQQTFYLDDEVSKALLSTYSTDNLSVYSGLEEDNLAYVIYTSGSTGQPKGVLTIHRNVVGLVSDHHYVCINPGDRIAQASNMAFDAITFEVWGALCNGAQLVYLDKDTLLDPNRLEQNLKQLQIQTLFVTTALFNQVAHACPQGFESLDYLLFGGELVNYEAVNRILAAGKPKHLLHVYGPTEATTFSTWEALNGVYCEAERPIAIGRPLQNMQLYVLDENKVLLPVGCVGELYIGGRGIACGYLNQPALTAEKFISNPFNDDSNDILYKTGDLVRWLVDGRIEFIGRADHQIKLRGFRIELGEIENQLNALGTVKDAIVLLSTTNDSENTSDSQLLAYIVPSLKLKSNPDECAQQKQTLILKCKQQLKISLPDYMMPSVFVVLPAFPLNANGKIDRKALPATHKEGIYLKEETYVAPRNARENQLCQLWQQLLKRELIGIHDNFFELGGHSLLATRLISLVRDELDLELPLRTLFEKPTIAELADALQENSAYNLPSIKIVDRQRALPLSYAQQRLWFIDRMEQGSAHYNIPLLYRLNGELNVSALQRALQRIVARHEVLRTHFSAEKDSVYQVIEHDALLPFQEIDLSVYPEDQQSEQLTHHIEAEYRQVFDLSQDVIFRVKLYRCASTDHVLQITMHHIASDGWSIKILIEELKAFYESDCQNRPISLKKLSVQYADYTLWQQQWLTGDMLANALAYWKTRLIDIPVVHSLPLDKPRLKQQRFRGASQRETMSVKLTNTIRDFCRSNDVTLFMFLQTAFSVLLSRYSGEHDIVIGTAIAGRTHRDLETLIGFFVNTLVLRNDLSENPSFVALLQANKRHILDAFTHQHVPFEMLVEELQPQRNLSHNPLVQVMLSLQNYEQPTFKFNDLSVEPIQQTRSVALFDLELEVYDSQGQLIIDWSYNRDIFYHETIARMRLNFECLLQHIFENPEQAVMAYDIVSHEEQHTLLYAWNLIQDTNVVPTKQYTRIHELFETWVQTAPERPALFFAEAALSYRQLNEKANRLAAYLLEHKLIVPEKGIDTLIGVYTERSPEMMIAILAILKAGAAYVPLDPTYPDERIQYMLEDAAIKCVLTQRALAEHAPLMGKHIVCLDGTDEQTLFENYSNKNLSSDQDHADTLAYVIYTSGSTGNPKGTCLQHQGLINLTFAQQQAFGIKAKDRLLQFASASFDAATWEWVMALSHGACLYLLPETAKQDAQVFGRYIREHQISGITLPPAFLRTVELKDLESVRILVTAGEALEPALANAVLHALPQTHLFNAYGPTETTVCATVYPIKTPQTLYVPIGKPLLNTQCYILNNKKQLAPVGVIGELYIGGIGLARDYLNRSELTAAKFVQNPFFYPDDHPSSLSDRLYRSGDLARWLPDGQLEFIGRMDHQIKLRGFRIELGEIEAQLLALNSIQMCAVMVRATDHYDKSLFAYIVPATRLSDNETDKQRQTQALLLDIKTRLNAVLPNYMVPTTWVMLTALPLTPNGKIDRKALAAMNVDAARESDYVAPRNAMEAQLCELWQSVLKQERVGINDNFFERGGHSLLATRLISMIRERFSMELPLRTLFENPTIADSAKYLQNDEGQKQENIYPVSLPPILVADRKQLLPLSFAQQRLWFIDQMEHGSPHYNMPSAYRLKGELNICALQKALNTIVERHEILRTHFISEKGTAYQVIKANAEVSLEQQDISRFNSNIGGEELLQGLRAAAKRVFDFKHDILLRANLFKCSDQNYVLLLLMHHIVSDGWSMQQLLVELQTLYSAYCQGDSNPLKPLSIQYADYACWQRDWLQGQTLKNELAYWRMRLQGIPPVLNLPLDKSRPAQQTFNGGTYYQQLDRQLTQQLHQACRQHEVTLFILLQTVFAILLGRYSNETDIVMASAIAGRTHRDIEPLIGFFVNTLVLRSDLSNNPAFFALLAENKRHLLDAYTHQHIPFEMLVEELQPQRSLSYNPIAQVMFTLQNNEQTSLALDGLIVSPENPPRDIALFDLELNVLEEGEALSLNWIYNTDLFQPETVQRFAKSYEILLNAILQSPDMPVFALPVLDEVERKKVLHDWNATAVNYPFVPCIHIMFEAQVQKTPNAIAVIYNSEQLTYQELNEKANQLARYLLEEGLQSEMTIGLCVERSLGMIVAIIAILKAGGAYIPLDPVYPRARLAYMLEDAQVFLVLTQSHLLEAIQLNELLPARKLICLDNEKLKKQLIQYDPYDLKGLALSANTLAYIIYTSGSTGKPKGVMIEHGSAVAMLHWAGDIFTPDQLGRTLCSTSVCFDLFVFEMWAPLVCGGLVLCVNSILDLVQSAGGGSTMLNPTLINTVPSAAAALLEQGYRFKNVNVVNLAGEPLPPRLLNALLATGDVKYVYNLYGPSEDTTYSTFDVYTQPVEQCSIGRAISNTRLYVLSAAQTLVPLGVPGELYIGGAGLARGYLRQPALTKEKFIRSPFSVHRDERLYRTGDLVRWLPDGRLAFLGRIDHQIKLRGFRIELGEIESQLKALDTVRDAIVIISEPVVAGNSDSRQLLAYIVSERPLHEEAEQQALIVICRRQLNAALPDYMLPAAFVVLDKFPLTPNGKLDRKALPSPDQSILRQHTYTPPRNVTEAQLCHIWQQLLKRELVGIYDNFFELGGHSLLALRLISAIRDEMALELPLKLLFEKPTVAAHADELKGVGEAYVVGQSLPALTSVNRDGALRLSFAQQRLWFIDQMEEGSAHYNMSQLYRLKGKLEIEALREAFINIIERHEVLRTCFEMDEGVPYQIIHQHFELPFEVVDLNRDAEADDDVELMVLLRDAATSPFDLGTDLMLRVGLYRYADDEFILLIVMHHIASDGWSIPVLMQELSILYQAFCEAASRETIEVLPRLKIQYADYAVWQNDWLQGEVLDKGLAYWKKYLQDIPVEHSLRLDKPRPDEQRFKGRSFQQVLDADLMRSLRAVAKASDVTVFMLLQTAFAILIGRYSGATDIVMGTPITGRMHRDFEALIGFFVNTLVLRTDLSGNPAFTELLAENKNRLLDAYTHQYIPFEMLVEALQPERRLNHNPLVQVMFSLQNNEQADLLLHGVTAESVVYARDVALFDLELNALEHVEGLDLHWTYNRDIFFDSTIWQLAHSFKVLLDGIIAHPETRIHALPLIDAKTQHQLLVEWNATVADYPKESSIHALFEHWAEETPNASAFTFEGVCLTYCELNEKANRLAHYLLEQDVVPDTLVGLSVDRSPDMLIGMLGILKAGGAYVPLDTSYPEERLRFMLDDADIRWVLTQRSRLEYLPLQDRTVFCMDGEYERDLLSTYSCENPVSVDGLFNSNQLSHVIYTSGSTGKPKGVLITHGNVVGLACDHHYIQINAGARVAQVSNMSFDAITFEIWGALCNGAQLVYISKDDLLDVVNLQQTLNKRKIQIMLVTTALFNQVAYQCPESFAGLDVLLFGGEQASYEAVNLVVRYGKPLHLLHAYGPTEATTLCTWEALDGQYHKDDRVIPIGRPMQNMPVYVVDQQEYLVPSGCVGELYVGGRGIARGYLNRPEFTREKFIPNPFMLPSSDAPLAHRLYKTGDLVRWLPDGRLAFVGRIDDQIKLHGFRIELSEIEAQLSRLDGVKDCLVLLSEDAEQGKRLIAYVIPAERLSVDTQSAGKQKQILVADFKQQLGDCLPAYMLPSIYVILDMFPLTANGKVDRKALPVPERDDISKVAYVSPKTKTEIELCTILQALLGLSYVSVTDHFFSLGGHSLLAIKFVMEINHRLGAKLKVGDIFRYPLIRVLAEKIDAADVSMASDFLAPVAFFKIERALKTLYCIPGAGGLAISFMDLAAEAKGQFNIKAFDQQGILEGSIAHDSIDGIVSDFLQQLLADQPQGPYWIAGHSFGGVIAFEMARHLEAMQHDVRVILLDSILLPGLYLLARSLDNQKNEISLLSFLQERYAESVPVDKSRVNISSVINEEVALRINRIFELQLKMAQTYRNDNVLKGDLLFFYAEASLPLFSKGAYFKALKALCHGEVIVQAVKGDHYSMLLKQGAQIMLKAISENLS